MLGRLAVGLCILTSAVSHLAAEDWGNLSLRFVYDGAPPKLRMLKVSPDKEISDESLLVHPKDKGLANVCVWLVADDDDLAPVHPDYELAANDKFAGTIRNGCIHPRVMIVRPPQSLLIRNEDRVAYNAQIDLPQNGVLNVV